MCLIAVKDKGKKLPKREYLYNSYLNNKDGIGIALLKEKKQFIYIKKNFKDFDSFYTWIKDNVKTNDKLIIHFRWATHGLVDIGNRHPFPITKNKVLLRKQELYCNYAVAHNGVLYQYSHKKYSDTQKFILDILARVKPKLYTKVVIKLINSYINGDRLAILNKEKGILLIGEFIEDEGIFWSNDGYKRKPIWESNEKEDFTLKWCEYCSSQKTSRLVEELDLYLCKKCRRKYRKGKISLPDKTSISKCGGCGNWFEIESLSQVGKNTYLCSTCFIEVSQAYYKGNSKYNL